MNYETAKKLKDAGFKFQEGYIINSDGIYTPSLSELIAACGEEEYPLDETPKKLRPKLFSLYWSTNDKGSMWACNGGMSYGSNPAEAVANLWLELNKK